MWKRYVDDTFVIQHQSLKEEFLRHINTVDPSIQFTVEESKDDGSFFGYHHNTRNRWNLHHGVYRKPTHIDLYLLWDSIHNLAAEYSVINTLTHSTHHLLNTKITWPVQISQIGYQEDFPATSRTEEEMDPYKEIFHTKCHIVIPYAQGICESIKNICEKHGVAVHFKGVQTLKDILVSPKDKDFMAKKNSVIYSYSCGRIDCEEEYIGELGRTFGERFKEHLKAPFPIFEHQNSSGHDKAMENFKIIAREENSLARTIKESMYIRVNNPTLNRNIGKYNLLHIWDRVLHTIPELKMNK